MLIFFQSLKVLEKFCESSQLSRSGFKDLVKVMTEKTSANDKEALIRQAVTTGSITLLTRVFGRGTDFIVYDEKLNASGGIHVVQTFFSEEYSEETQIKGRTARQGNKGSFSMVLLESELEKYHITSEDTKMMISTKNIYDKVHKQRIEFFDAKFPESMRYVAEIKSDHACAQTFAGNLANVDMCLAEVKAFLIEENRSPYVGEETTSRTICLMDATGSMSLLLLKCKNTVQAMFTRAHTVLGDAGVHEGSFELQFAVYRNYSSGVASILQHSTWESEPSNLRLFFDSVKCEGGQGNEAVEIGFAHVNDELSRGEVSQVLLIGDMPPNTREEVCQKRGTDYNWSCTKYSEPTFYLDELEKIIQRKTTVHAFYVNSAASCSFAEIAELSGGVCSSLDVDSMAGSEMLTSLVTE